MNVSSRRNRIKQWWHDFIYMSDDEIPYWLEVVPGLALGALIIAGVMTWVYVR